MCERFAAPPPAPENPTPVEAMSHRLRTPEGKKLYALRKQTPEPVFGIIKSVMGFRQFSLRGLDKVRGEVEGLPRFFKREDGRDEGLHVDEAAGQGP